MPAESQLHVGPRSSTQRVHPTLHRKHHDRKSLHSIHTETALLHAEIYILIIDIWSRKQLGLVAHHVAPLHAAMAQRHGKGALSS